MKTAKGDFYAREISSEAKSAMGLGSLSMGFTLKKEGVWPELAARVETCGIHA